MRTNVASDVVVFNGRDEFSQAISMEGSNAVGVSVAISFLAPSAQLDVYLQESNDLENWEDVATFAMRVTTIGYAADQEAELSMGYIRLRYAVSTGESVVLTAQVNAYKQ